MVDHGDIDISIREPYRTVGRSFSRPPPYEHHVEQVRKDQVGGPVVVQAYELKRFDHPCEFLGIRSLKEVGPKTRAKRRGRSLRGILMMNRLLPGLSIFFANLFFISCHLSSSLNILSALETIYNSP